jgi:LacI family transcriptional regulator/LacI family asc operon transcriptional repressor
MNIYDISKKAGVSIATVSRVINGATNVSEKTRKKVLAIMEETDYTPNAFARGLTNNTIKTIGLMCADCSDHFLASAIAYLETGFRSYGYDCILCNTGYEPYTRAKYMKLLLAKKVDAIVLIGSSFIHSDEVNNQYLYDASQDVPIVVINGYIDSPNIYCTLCDDEDAIYGVTKKFIANGFKNSLFLYRANSPTGLNKLKGFKKAYNDAEITLNPKQFLMYDDNILNTKSKLLSYYENEFKFDSVVAGDDELAVSALKYAKTSGLSIPDKFAVSGYDNSTTGLCCEPELSTIDNKLEYICSNSVAGLMNILSGENMPHKTLVSGEFIQRGTTNFK